MARAEDIDVALMERELAFRKLKAEIMENKKVIMEIELKLLKAQKGKGKAQQEPTPVEAQQVQVQA